jgi:hypothetical protein
MKSSIITGLNFDSSVQLMSINSATDLTVSKLTMDNSAGDSLGHNTAASMWNQVLVVSLILPLTLKRALKPYANLRIVIISGANM